MNLDYLRYFIKLAELGHYTKAAEQLCIAQPSLSHAIRQLENELGVPLFEKTGRNTTMTRFGEEFLTCAQHTLATLDEGVASLQRSSRGEGLIRLGFLRPLGTRYIPELAARFLSENSSRKLQFTFHTERTKALLDGLTDHRYDLVFCSKPQTDSQLTAVAVARQELVLIVPKKHPLATRHSVDLAETTAYPVIYFAEGSGVRNVVDEMYLAIHAVPRIVLETEEDQVIAGLVAQGFGIAVVPYMDLLLKLDVSILQITTPPYKREIFMVHDNTAFLPPAAQRFRQFVLEEDQNEDSI